MKGYQFLENDFFDLCETREIGHTPMLLYIYLRGLYCRFQKPIFTWHDKTASKHLRISQSTLSRARDYLKTRGLVKFASGKGNNPTEYTMLGTTLLPVLKKQAGGIVKMTTGYRHTRAQGYRQNDDTYNTSKERVKNRIGITPTEVFKGMTPKDREELKRAGLLKEAL